MVTDNKEIRCTTCERLFTPTRSDAQFCSSACRQKAYRKSKPKVTTGLALRSELTPKQELFVQAYLVSHNGTQSAIQAGYSKKSASQTASRLLVDGKVQEAIRARGAAALEKLEVTEDMVLQELAAIAFSNIKKYVTWDADAGELIVKSSEDIPDALAAAIESIDEQVLESKNKDGSRIYTRTKRKVKLYPKLEALKTLAEYLGLTDSMAPKVQVYIKTGIDRTPDPVDVEAEAVVENPPENRASEPL